MRIVANLFISLVILIICYLRTVLSKSIDSGQVMCNFGGYPEEEYKSKVQFMDKDKVRTLITSV